MRIGLMVEGQSGLTWDRWSYILKSAEDLDIPSVFRSDHYHIMGQQNSLEAYLSFVIAAKETSKIRFGPLVSPITFRSPVDIGRMAAQLHQLSEGRFLLGLGAGWFVPEHETYGIAFPGTKERLDRLEEGIEVIRTLWGEGPASYTGQYYRLREVDCLPKPLQGAATPILIGGTGEKRTLPLAVRVASEWNSTPLSPTAYAGKVETLNRLCEEAGRDPASITRSMMAFGLVASDQRMLDRLTQFQMDASGVTGSLAAFRETLKTKRGFIVGLTNEVADILGQYAALGLDEIDFEQFDFDSNEVPAYLARELAPLVA